MMSFKTLFGEILIVSTTARNLKNRIYYWLDQLKSRRPKSTITHQLQGRDIKLRNFV
jgi:hypothetical protein